MKAVKVWEPDGRLAWTNVEPQRIGHRFPLEGPLEKALRDNEATAGFISKSHANEEDKAEAGLGLPSLLQVYAPIMGSHPGQVIGAYEIYADPSAVNGLIGSRREMIWIAVGVVVPRPLGGACAPRAAGIAPLAPAERRAADACCEARRVEPVARGECARGRREPQRNG